MPATIYNITFVSIPAVNESINVKAHIKTPPNGLTQRIETFKTNRSNPGETTIGANLNAQAQNFYNSFLTDYASGGNIIASVDGATVTLQVDPLGSFDYFDSIIISGPYAILTPSNSSVILSGLNSDLYLINNEIIISLSTSLAYPFYTIQFKNLSNQKISNLVKVYPDGSNIATLNISPYIKGLFEYPSDADGYVIDNQNVPNSNKFEITVSNGVTSPSKIIKTFVRGGNKTNDTNQTLSVLDVLRPTLKLPIWTGFETASYYINGDGLMIKQLLGSLPFDQKDFRRPKGCNEIYVKFLNQKGGYSNWLFESHSETNVNQNLGNFIRNNKVDDFGNSSDSKIQVYSKVPKYYIGIINDLIISPEIYVYIDGVEIRVTSGRNSIEYDSIKRAYSVNINLDYQFRFNPSLLWSN